MAKNLNRAKANLRQAGRKYKQDINKLNRGIKKYNNTVKREVDNLNNAVRNYNKIIRNVNATTKKNLRIISNGIPKVNTSLHTEYAISVQTMKDKYVAVDSAYPEGCEVTPEQDQILNLIDQEQANSVVTANVIENNELPEEDTDDIEIGNKLLEISENLNNCWRGAVYALNPANPDAARQFCTSSREIFTGILEIKAPNKDVIEYNPNCEIVEDGIPTRKEKIRYMMRDKTMNNTVIDFADADIDNIIKLIHDLNIGTHGPSGEYDFNTLIQVKKRVEQGIYFLCEISAQY